MTSTTTKPAAIQPEAETAVYLFDDWFDRSKLACAIGSAISSRR
jgi:hypothetical protein